MSTSGNNKIPEALAKEIMEQARKADVYKVILFGSHAYGNPQNDSDLDLYIISKKRYLPQNYQENMNHYRSISKYFRSLKKKYPVDLIIHTYPMHKKFLDLNSSFSRQIMNHGKILYEADNS